MYVRGRGWLNSELKGETGLQNQVEIRLRVVPPGFGVVPPGFWGSANTGRPI